jgi:hypothetical protein
MLVIPRLSVRPFVLLRISMPIMKIAFGIIALGHSQSMYILSMCILGMGQAGPCAVIILNVRLNFTRACHSVNGGKSKNTSTLQMLTLNLNFNGY